MRLSHLIFLFPLLLVSCFSDDNSEFQVREEATSESVEFPNVDQELWSYFERFESAALDRGIEIDLASAGIIGQFEEIDENNVAGRCNYHSQQPELVTIDEEFWSNASDLLREMVVFHELGHCQLIRDHREAQNGSGQCLSIMASGIGGCQLQYTTESRNQYLDELFDTRFAGDWF